MTKKVEDFEVIGPDAEAQYIKDSSGQAECRLRSEGSRAMVISNEEQALKLIGFVAAKFAPGE